MKALPKSAPSAGATREEQREALASIGMFAAAMAHEIRNPLTAIKARLFTLKKALAADSPAREDAEIIGQEIGRLEHIVREFLQYARPAEPLLRAVAPGDLLGDVVALLGLDLKRRGIELAPGALTETRAHADPHQIKQVLINLVQNAAESIGEIGRITLGARDGALAEGGRRAVVLEVADTGKGIPSEFHENLFDPFFTDKPSGTGLGLPIAARIVAKHGGAITFRSEAAGGTTFSIALPAAENA